MRKTILSLCCLGLFTVSTYAQNEDESSVSIYLGGLIALPSSDGFSHSYDEGYHAFAGIGGNLSDEFHLIGKAEYTEFDLATSNSDPFDGNGLSIWSFGGDLRYALGSDNTAKLRPFLLGGVGVAVVDFANTHSNVNIDVDNNNNQFPLTDRPNDEKFYYNVGVGMELTASENFGLFIQGRYVSIATTGENMSYVPISLGLRIF